MNEQKVVATGTGVLLHYSDQEFIATALHVAKQCDFNPMIDYKGQWTKSSWKTIGVDEENDIAILQRIGTEDSRIAWLSAMYGDAGATYGAICTALGFPQTHHPIEWMRFSEDLRPIPLSTSLLLYLTGGDTHYSGGYLNHGFSGGPIVAWSGTHCTIIGIITTKSLVKTVYDNQIRTEHAGLVGFAGIRVVERLLSSHMNHDIQDIKPWKPQPSHNQAPYPQPASLSTAEILGSVIRLGSLIKT